MRIDVRGDARAVLRDLGTTVPGITDKAVVTAMNKTNDKLNTQFRRALARRTGIKQKTLKGTIRKFRANKNRVATAVWMGLNRRIALGAVQTGNSVRAQYRPFLEESLGGRSTDEAFKVRGGWYVREGPDRLPLRRLTLNIGDEAARAMDDAEDQVGPAVFRSEFARDISRRLARHGVAGSRSGRGRARSRR